MSKPQLTEERLRSWLDSNQVKRERMCRAVLGLNSRYSNVRPRRPKGGPDGARDIEAVYEDDLEVWGAVGFRNSVSDSPEDKRSAKKKFIDDLHAALDGNPELQGFVFFSNVDLTPAEKNELERESAQGGIEMCDIYDRERLRGVLDSPEGYGFRFSYLDIPLSEAEQTAFFERFGSDLEKLILRQFDAVDRKLARIEFFHDCGKELYNLSAIIKLDQAYEASELGHFRFLFEILNLNEREPHPTLWLAGRDAYPVLHNEEEEGRLPGIKMLAWSRGPDAQIQNTVLGLGISPVTQLSCFTGIYGRGPFTRLGVLDHKHLNVYVTQPLWEKTKAVGLIANDYLIASAEKDNLVPRDSDPVVDWPEELTDKERNVPWTALLLKGDNPSLPPPAWRTRNWFIDFGIYTPQKVRAVASPPDGGRGATT